MIIQKQLMESLQKFGDNIAIEYGNEHISYSQLLKRADAVTARLLEEKLNPETIVGISQTNKVDIISSMIGILNARCVFVLLDHSLPALRLESIIKNLSLEYSISPNDNDILATLTGSGIKALRPDEAAVISELKYPSFTDDDSAYIYFTSGSTGIPKGIIGRNASLIQFLQWEIAEFQVNEQVRVSQFISPYFDAFLRDVFVPLLTGGTLCIPPDEPDFFTSEKIAAWIDDTRVSMIHCVPSVFREIKNNRHATNSFTHLKYILMSGERLVPSELTDWYKSFGSRIQLVNLYGTTETTMIRSFYRIQANDVSRPRIPIGAPIADTTLLIANKDMKPCDKLVAGDLYIVSNYMSKGYLNLPELTKEKFITIQLGDEPVPAFKTGDKARVQADGTIDLIGREDRQIKLRGIRIELDEIENVMVQCDLLKRAVVAVDTTDETPGSGDQSLAAFVIPNNENETADVPELVLQFVSDRLPKYMVPSRIVSVAQYPLLTNGKIDLKELLKRKAPIKQLVEPVNETEARILAIWKEILGQKEFSTSDNFTQVGGNSLTIMRLIGRLNKDFSVRITLREIFENLSIQKQATFIDTSIKTAAPAVTRTEQESAYALSSAQKRLYFLHNFDRRSLAYNIPQIVTLGGKLEKKKLERVFRSLIARHESLRTSFVLNGDEPVQKIAKHVPLPIEYFTAANAAEIQKSVDKFVRPFDLRQAPLLRIGLIEISNTENILMVDMHHIVSDGISQSILIKEFMELYGDKELSDVGVQYKDFVKWQQSDFQQAEVTKQKAFWLNEYSSGVPKLDLPLDFTRPSVMVQEGAVYNFDIDSDLTARLQAIANKENATIYMVMLAAFNVLLAKLSNQDDIVVGTPLSGRDHSDFQNTIGMFVNTLPMRNFPGSNKTFREFLVELRQRTIACFDNQAYPYESLIDDLNVERDTSRNPLLDVMFTYQNYELAELSIPGLVLKPYEIGQAVSKFDITLFAFEGQDRISFNFEYSTALFKKKTIKRFSEYFLTILSEIIRDADQKISDIDVLSPSERKQLLFDLNETEGAYPVERLIHQLFEEQVEKTPGNIALVYGDRRITYRELNTMANQVAVQLREKGVGVDKRVGVMIDKSPELLISIFGILKAGGAYVPIDPEYPQARVEYILRDSSSSVLLVAAQAPKLGTFDGEIIDVKKIVTKDKDVPNPVNIAGASNLIYVIYTSGSSGQPKGVMIEHGPFMNLMHWFTTEFNFDRQEKTLLIAPVSFDLAQKNIYGALISGGTLVLPEDSRNYDHLSRIVRKENITNLNCSPSAFYPLLDMAEAKNYSELTSLRKVFLGGEPIALDKIQRWTQSRGYSGTDIVNTYGPTEFTDIASFHRLTRAEIADGDSGRIGKPILNNKVYVLDPAGKPVPFGVSGELYISGVGAGRGYLNNEQLTKEKFVANPFVEGAIMYRTGDMARWYSDGTLAYMGRVDRQVKIRGFRIETTEIEAKLNGHADIDQTFVTALQQDDDKYLVAYYTSKDELTSSELRAFLSGELPEFMLPTFYVRLQEMPLTPNGKVNVAKLPAPAIVETETYVGPSNDTEEKLVAIWSEVLKIEKDSISVHKTFFELGGHSLKAILIVNKVQRQFSVEVPLKKIFEHQTISGFAKFLLTLGEREYKPIPRNTEKKEYYQLTNAQKAMYFVHEFDKNSLAYNQPRILLVEGRIDKQKIVDTFYKLMDRHEMLRTSFRIVNDQPVQVVWDKLDLRVDELTAAEHEVRDILEAMHRPFDLTKAPLLRVAIIEIGPDRNVLFVDTHHIVMDGISNDIFTNEFAQLYNGVDLPEPSLRFSDYLDWYLSEAHLKEIARQKEFWIKEFADGIPKLELPTDFTRPAVKSQEGKRIYFTLTTEETDKIWAIVDDEKATFFMLMFSMYNVLLSKLSGQEDIVVGTAILGRDHYDLEGMIGLFANGIPLRNFPKSDMSFREFLHDLKIRTLNCFDNQGYQYEAQMNELKIDRDASHHPFFDAMFMVNNYDTSELSIPGLTFKSYGGGIRESKFDLSLMTNESRDQIHAGFEFCTRLFKEETIERFINYFKQIVKAVTEKPDMLLSGIELVTPDERSKILHEFNAPPVSFDRSRSLIQIIREQASHTPDAVAVAHNERQLSYQELCANVDKLAAQLSSVGVCPGDNVTVFLPRGVELLTTMLSIFKVGGTYVPVDTDYPMQRIESIVSDSNSRLVVTDDEGLGVLSDLSGPIAEKVGMISIESPDLFAPLDRIYEYDEKDVAYMIYTSGTTGKPKGVMIHHLGMMNHLYAKVNDLKITSNDVIIQSASPCFDISIWQFLAALMVGGTTRIVDRNIVTEPDLLFKELQSATIFESVPSLMSSFLDALPMGPKVMRNLRWMIATGEPLRNNLIAKWKENFPTVKLLNAYGPTEASDDITHHVIDGIQGTEVRVSVGRPVQNMHIYIVDKDKNLCPIGVNGEICVAGLGVGKGYWNRDEETRKAFVPNPFESDPEYAVMYRTGDWGYYQADGTIVCLGRKDHQVKIRGFRIELGEIEKAVASIPDIKQSVVIVKEKDADKFVAAFYTSDVEIEEDNLHERVGKVLPDFMIPSFFIRLGEIPVTSNGKLDLKALPDLAMRTFGQIVAPKTEIERGIAAMWAEILKMEQSRIGTDINFFHIGGHSLNAIALINKIDKAYNVKISLRKLFGEPTIKLIARHVEESLAFSDESVENDNHVEILI